MANKPTIELMDKTTLVKGENIDLKITERNEYIVIHYQAYGFASDIMTLTPEDALAFGTALKERAEMILHKKTII